MTRKEIIANLCGIFAPVTTPFNRRGGIDEGLFRKNLMRYSAAGLSGIVIAGSTGEAPYLTGSERLRLVEIARAHVRPPMLLIVGTGLESTSATLQLSREAIRRGADLALIVTPNYYKSRMDSGTLTRHYRALADGLKRPVIVYNIPQFTGIKMEPEAIAGLSRHPNIAGLKESSGDLAYVREILRAVSQKGKSSFRVLVGAALIIVDALQAGAVGGILGQSDFAPEICVGLYDAFERGDLTTARKMQERLVPLVQKISVPFGVPGIKAALELSGYVGGSPRPPLGSLNRAARKLVAAAIAEAHAGLKV